MGGGLFGAPSDKRRSLGLHKQFTMTRRPPTILWRGAPHPRAKTSRTKGPKFTKIAHFAAFHDQLPEHASTILPMHLHPNALRECIPNGIHGSLFRTPGSPSGMHCSTLGTHARTRHCADHLVVSSRSTFVIFIYWVTTGHSHDTTKHFYDQG